MDHWQIRAQTGSGAVFSCGLRASGRAAAEQAARDMLPPSFLLVPAWVVITEVIPLSERAPQARDEEGPRGL